MSEEILKALMQLFAIIAKQDVGVDKGQVEYVEKFLTQQLNEEAVKEYMDLFYKQAGDSEEPTDDDDETNEKNKKRKRTSVTDSVRTLKLCRQINKTLNQAQKVVVLVRLFEIIYADRKFTEQRMAIINTVADVFKFTKEEYKSIETFVIQNDPTQHDDPHVLIIDDKQLPQNECKHIISEELDGDIFILQIKSVELYFLKYTGKQDVLLNGLAISNRRIYLFASGSSIKVPKGKPIYYSDVVTRFMADMTTNKLTFNVNNLSFRFPNGNFGIKDISFSESHGKLIGIMGASGAGKTTLLNVLCGIDSPSDGEVLINGINLHTQKKELEGVIGYIPQDDLLIEELTVFQNLYFCAKQCFKYKSEEEINELVANTLKSLGLFDRKDLKVGSPLNKMISGGQRKRLNIALELIREPSILFVDEPTSGLSSRDSENVMDLLSVLALKGKLIFVVIHQPSADIFKMFDRILILDTGGFQIYYGNPIESIMYFKRIDQQINADIGECPTCGNVTPELIFNIVEARVVDEYGRYTDHRKVSPTRWKQLYEENIKVERYADVKEAPPISLNIPAWLQQFKIYATRDFLSKISNRQYVILNLVESPLLAFILSFIIRYIADPQSSKYIFFDNENIPPYIFMSIVVALFLGLMVSAEEIYRDRKVLKREKFLNLSRSSYLMSKVLILFVISAIQCSLFVILGNNILGIRGMFFDYWYVLFATAAFANMLGLNISSAFNSAVTIYILIPLLMIPQMALGGAMFSFDKLNRAIGSVDKVPIVAEIMTSRWAYESLVVHQFKDNEFEKNFFEVEKKISNSDFKIVNYIPRLESSIDEVVTMIAADSSKKTSDTVLVDLALLKREIKKETDKIIDKCNFLSENLSLGSYNPENGEELRQCFKFAYTKVLLEDEQDELEEVQDIKDTSSIKSSEEDDSENGLDDSTKSGFKIGQSDVNLNLMQTAGIEKKKDEIEVNDSLKSINKLLDQIIDDYNEQKTSKNSVNLQRDLANLKNEIPKLINSLKNYQIDLTEKLNADKFNKNSEFDTKKYLKKLKSYHSSLYSLANEKRRRMIDYINDNNPGLYNSKKNNFHNEAISDYARKTYERNKIIRYKDQLIQQYEPIFLDPSHYNYFDFRAHFYAPRKYFAGTYFDTFNFNVIIIWIFTLLFYIALYYDLLKRGLVFFEKFKFKKRR